MIRYLVVTRLVFESSTGLQGDCLGAMPRSLVSVTPTGRRVDGAPVYEFVRSPAGPPVSVLRFPAGDPPTAHQNPEHAHVHDFLVLAYFERGAGTLRLGSREWPLSSGDAFVIAPGEVVRLSGHTAEGWCVFFPPELIAAEPRGGSLGWRPHPLLYRFAGRAAGGAERAAGPAGAQ